MLGKADASHRNVAGKQEHRGQQSEQKDRDAGIKKHGARAQQQKKAQAAPAVAPAAQVRRPPPAVGRQTGRHLGDAQVPDRRLDDHFEREFHPCRVEVERQHGVAAKAPQPAIKILAGAAIQGAADEGQEGVTENPVQGGHSPGRDPAPETVAEHQVIAVAQLFDKRLQG